MTDTKKLGGELGPPTHAPSTVRRDEGARANSRGGRAETKSAGGNLLPRRPLTAEG